jgi:type II secretory pathway pseudopilin PulG
MILTKQHGETIVEVLISMAVLGLVLSATYGLANKSTQANRQAQERAEALGENTARLEQFKTFLEDGGSIPGGFFCVFENNTGGLQATSGGFSGGIPPDPEEDALDNYPNQCKSGPDNRYNTAVRKIDNSDGTDTYVVTTRWSRVSGTGVEELSIEYKTYEPSQLAYNPDEDAILPQDIAILDCDPGSYLFDESAEDACRPCPPGFSSPGGLVTECTFSVSLDGASYYECRPNYEVQGPSEDGREGCFRSGTSEYSWRGVDLYYRFPGTLLSDKPVRVKFTYRNWASNPPPDYHYILRAWISPGDDPYPDPDEDDTVTNFHLPSGPPSEQKTFESTLTPISGSSVYLSITWWNDSWTGGDANLQIEKITFTQAAP